jgi:hypothetical protein
MPGNKMARWNPFCCPTTMSNASAGPTIDSAGCPIVCLCCAPYEILAPSGRETSAGIPSRTGRSPCATRVRPLAAERVGGGAAFGPRPRRVGRWGQQQPLPGPPAISLRRPGDRPAPPNPLLYRSPGARCHRKTAIGRRNWAPS